MFGSSLDRFIRRAVACYVVKADCADRRCGIEEKGLQEILLGRKMVPQRCLRAAQLGRDCRHRRCGISMVEKMSSGDFENFTPFSRMIFVASRLRSEEHTSELQSLMRISYAVFCLKKKKNKYNKNKTYR